MDENKENSFIHIVDNILSNTYWLMIDTVDLDVITKILNKCKYDWENDLDVLENNYDFGEFVDTRLVDVLHLWINGTFDCTPDFEIIIG